MPGIAKSREQKRARRHLRVRKKVTGTPERPRLVIFRSLKHITAQLGLVIGFLIHEVQEFTIIVQVLHLIGFHADVFHSSSSPPARNRCFAIASHVA